MRVVYTFAELEACNTIAVAILREAGQMYCAEEPVLDLIKKAAKEQPEKIQIDEARRTVSISADEAQFIEVAQCMGRHINILIPLAKSLACMAKALKGAVMPLFEELKAIEKKFS